MQSINPGYTPIVIRQSLIKQFKSGCCTEKIRMTRIEQAVEEKPTEPMMLGRYFEDQCLSLKRNDPSPLLKSGAKPAHVLRVDEQVLNFRKVYKEYNMKVSSVQEEIVLPYATDEELKIEYYVGGILDFTSSIHDDVLGYQPEAIIDLKLTGSINQEFGDFSWRYPANMDHIQAQMYVRLYEQKYGKRLPFYYMVFDYKIDSDYTIIRKNITQMDMLELDESIRKTMEAISGLYRDGTTYFPSYDNCNRCPLKQEPHNCKWYNNKKQITVV